MRRDTGEMDDPGIQFDEKRGIEPAEQNDVPGEEVARVKTLRLDAEELGPGRTRPRRRADSATPG